MSMIISISSIWNLQKVDCYRFVQWLNLWEVNIIYHHFQNAGKADWLKMKAIQLKQWQQNRCTWCLLRVYPLVFRRVLRIQCPIFLFSPLPHILPLWLRNCSRLYSLLSDEKETSACSGIKFLTMAPFVLVQSGNRGEMERMREEKGKKGREKGGGSLPR